MPQFNPDAKAFEEGVRTYFLQHFPPPTRNLIDLACHVEPSVSWQNEYETMDDPPNMEEFKGERVISPMTGSSYTIANLTYTADVAVGVGRTVVEVGATFGSEPPHPAASSSRGTNKANSLNLAIVRSLLSFIVFHSSPPD